MIVFSRSNVHSSPMPTLNESIVEEGRAGRLHGGDQEAFQEVMGEGVPHVSDEILVN